MASFSTKNIVVTGGAGFLGSFLCEKLLAEGSNVICVDSFVTSSETNIDHLLKQQNFEFLRADVNEPLHLDEYPELIRFKIPVHGIQEVYHLACPTSVRRFDHLKMQTLLANSVGMRNVLDVAVQYKARFFLASTSVVYGARPSDGHAFHENELGVFDHMSPRAVYDEGKRWAETAVATYRDVYNLDVRIGRIFRTYGPRMPLDDGQMIPDFVINALDGNDLMIYGDREFRTSLLFVTDAVSGILALMRSPMDPGPTNIGSDHDVRLVDVAEKIIAMTESTSKVAFGESLLFMSELGLPDLAKAKEELGWLALVTLDQGLKKMIEYTIAHRGLIKPLG